MNSEEAIAALDAIEADVDLEARDADVEGAHADADDVLLATVDPEVAAAYNRVIQRVGAWWYA